MEAAAPPALARLPPAAAGRLRTSTIIGSLAQAVEEVVHNAIDAGATSVAVTLDAGAGAASCADDGRGIRSADLRLLGDRHCTSKLASLAQLRAGVPTLGFRGEALASIAGARRVRERRKCRGATLTSQPACRRRHGRAGGADARGGRVRHGSRGAQGMRSGVRCLPRTRSP
jgi:hypothetical protein